MFIGELSSLACISMDSQRNNQDHHYNQVQKQDQDQDQDQDRNPKNVSGIFLNGYSSHDHSGDHVHLQTSCNNSGVLGLHESYNNHQFPANRIILNPQGRGPIGLILDKSLSFIKGLELILNKEKQQETHEFEEQLVNDQPPVKKLKVNNIPAVFLKIGSWKWVSKNEGDLVAKFYYGRKKLIWEFLYGSLKKKIEIGWSQISAINAFVGEDKKGVLEIELNEQPEYCQEERFEAGKHTKWGRSDDFTEGQAPVCRRHTVVFLPGVLDEAFKKLLQCDSRLLNVSRQPFPTHNSPLFCNQQILDFSNNRSIVHGSSSVPAVSSYGRSSVPAVSSYGSSSFPAVSSYGSSSVPAVSNNDGHQGTFQNLVQPISSFVDHSNSNLPMPDLKFSNSDELAIRASFQKQRVDGICEQRGNSQVQEISFPPIGDKQDHLLANHGEESLIPDQEMKLHLTGIQNLAGLTKELPWIPDLQQEPHLTNIHNPEDQFANEQNCFEVVSTYNPFKQNHQINSLQASGNTNEMIDGFTFDDVDQSHDNSEFSFKEHNSWNPMETRIHDSNIVGGVTNHMAYVDEDLCSVDHGSVFFNNRFSFMEPSSFLPSQLSIQDFNNGGNGMNEMGYTDNMNLQSFIPSGGNGELAVQNPNHGAN